LFIPHPTKLFCLRESSKRFYNLIFTSRKPEAKRFRKWVTGEVLPAIRKTGSYALATDKEDWFSRFARILCLWDAAGEAAARQEWQATGLSCPMPRKHGIRAPMEPALDLPAHLLAASGTGRTITNPPQRRARRQRRNPGSGAITPLPHDGEGSHACT
jgi:hypothetical protein